MANTNTGGVISGGVQLTCYADAELSPYQPVEIVDDYKVAVPTTQASLNVIGVVGTANTAAGRDLSVSARGTKVITGQSAAALAVGAVVVNADGKFRNYNASYPGGGDSCCAIVGWALTHADGADEDVDILM